MLSHQKSTPVLDEIISGVPLEETALAELRPYLRYCLGKGRLFGEHLPMLLADYFGLSDPWPRRTLSALTVMLRAFTVLDDDLRDVPSLRGSTTLHTLRNHFLDSAFDLIRSDIRQVKEALSITHEAIETYLRTATRFDRIQTNDWQKATPSSYSYDCASRMAAINVPVLLVGSLANDDHLVPNAQNAICNLMHASQMLDDLVDWEEDLDEGRVGYPLISLLYSASESTTGPRTCISRCVEHHDIGAREELRATLATSCVIIEHLCEVSHRLTLSLRNLNHGEGRRLFEIVLEKKSTLDRLLSSARNTVHGGPELETFMTRLKSSGIAPRRGAHERL